MDNNNLIEVSHLKKYFPIKSGLLQKIVGHVKAVDDVSFTIKKGQTFGLVGESGCGKTTIGRTILRLIEPTAGSAVIDGVDIFQIHSKELLRRMRQKMQLIFQDPYSSLNPRIPIGEIIGEAVREHNLVSKGEYRDYVLKTMIECGLRPYYIDRYPHEFSGGQRQRICIARALALKPQLIVADEPVSALDVSIQAQIINLLKDLQDSKGITFLFISHDLSVVEYISDVVGVMYLGNLVELAPKKELFKQPLHPYTKALLSAVPVPNPDIKMNRIILEGDIPSPANPPSGCKFHTRCKYCMEVCKKVAPPFKEIAPEHFVACHLYDVDLARTASEQGSK
ncbi:MAG: peptide ABC transporter substrate-binding protein [Clostridiales bacterium GWF2_38_85]|nr:MAG: peptide ABC transporter substrate-binding protein [Clostridiales bacterium GWF2_38_85]HBL84758.1 peptide ABC transporter substrate-binding protein [Clostridiales bacterium]